VKNNSRNDNKKAEGFVKYLNKQNNIHPITPGIKYVFVVGAILLFFDLIAYIFVRNQLLEVTPIWAQGPVSTFISSAFLFVAIFLGLFCASLLLVLSQRWIVTNHEFIIKNLFHTTMYNLTDIGRIYVTKVPIDPKPFKAASIFSQILSAFSGFGGKGMPVFSESSIRYLASKYGPKGIWMDIIKGGKLQSIQLMDVSNNQAQRSLLDPRYDFLLKLLKVLPKSKIDQKVLELLR